MSCNRRSSAAFREKPQQLPLYICVLRAAAAVAHGNDINAIVNYGHAIKMTRTARSLTQKQLAKRLGVAASFVSLLEAGKRKPSVDTLEHLCVALDVPMHLLVLMASSDRELRGVDAVEARTLGVHLLRLLTATQDQNGSSR